MLAVLLLATFAAPVSAQTPPRPEPTGASVITEVHRLGFRVSAVAIEYSQVVALPESGIPSAAFDVTVERNGITGPRTVINAYASRSPSTTDARVPGRFLILELDPADPNAGAGFDAAGLVVGSYTVTQTQDIVGPGGSVRLAAGAPLVSSGVINPVVDEFADLSITGTSGAVLPYRLFSPDAAGIRADRAGGQVRGKTYPLVVFLHGAGERGTNNVAQLVANEGAMAFARPDRQASDPSFVLAPQASFGQLWTTPAVKSALLELIEDAIDQYAIDPDRVYLTGLSLGGNGTFDLLSTRPDLFAAAIPVCGWGDATNADVFAHIPIWATHSIDDPIVPYGGNATFDATAEIIDAIEAGGTPVTRGEWPGNLDDAAARAAAGDLVDEAQAAGSHTLFTTWPAGTSVGPVEVPAFIWPHFAWVPTYSNDVILDWLFSQRRDPAN
jgi:predicted peptidase